MKKKKHSKGVQQKLINRKLNYVPTKLSKMYNNPTAFKTTNH